MSRSTGHPFETLTFSVVGAKHERAARPGQDAHGHETRGAATAVAVADGHGACARGDVGARFAVDAALVHLLAAWEHLAGAGLSLESTEDLFLSQVRRQIVQEWQECVAAHLQSQPTPPPDGIRAYGTTLIFALATPEFLAFGQLGDGDALLVDATARVRRPLTPEPLAFAGETPSMCEAQAWLRMRVAVLPRDIAPGLVCLMTDGYTNAYASDGDLDEVARGYARLLDTHGPDALARALPGFLHRVSREGSGDDVSLALMRLPRPIPNPDTRTDTRPDGETHDPL
jgi:hypothetical protein